MQTQLLDPNHRCLSSVSEFHFGSSFRSAYDTVFSARVDARAAALAVTKFLEYGTHVPVDAGQIFDTPLFSW